MTIDFKVNLDKQAEAILPEEPVWEGRWMIVVFDTSGKSYPDPSDPFNTEQEAISHISEIELYTGQTAIGARDNTWIFQWEDYSHSIPMPIRECGE